jgi:hypothetical protein
LVKTYLLTNVTKSATGGSLNPPPDGILILDDPSRKITNVKPFMVELLGNS